MFKLKFAISAAVAALALGGASAMAGGGGHPDNHGADVSSAARTCPTAASGAHGECVSDIASTNSP
jgi:hypothetical protein